MKKNLVILLTVLSLFFNCAHASANYPSHLHGDNDYILVDGHMGVAWYLDRTTLNVEKYEPPIYIITADVITAEDVSYDEKDENYTRSGKIIKTSTMRFFYNYQDNKMYVDTTGHDGWQYMKPLGSWAETGVSMPAGEMAFYLAYNMKFYGDHKYSDNILKDITPFDTSFYTTAKNY